MDPWSLVHSMQKWISVHWQAACGCAVFGACSTFSLLFSLWTLNFDFFAGGLAASMEGSSTAKKYEAHQIKFAWPLWLDIVWWSQTMQDIQTHNFTCTTHRQNIVIPSDCSWTTSLSLSSERSSCCSCFLFSPTLDLAATEAAGLLPEARKLSWKAKRSSSVSVAEGLFNIIASGGVHS